MAERWVKVISETEKNGEETSPSVLHEYRKCRELQTTKLPAVDHKGKTPKQKSLKERRLSDWSGRENSCIFAEKFAGEGKACSREESSYLKENDEEVTIVPFEKISVVLCRAINTSRALISSKLFRLVVAS